MGTVNGIFIGSHTSKKRSVDKCHAEIGWQVISLGRPPCVENPIDRGCGMLVVLLEEEGEGFAAVPTCSIGDFPHPLRRRSSNTALLRAPPPRPVLMGPKA